MSPRRLSNPTKLQLEPWFHRHDERTGLLDADPSAPFGGPAVDPFLDRVELGDAAQGLRCNRRARGLMQLVELAPDVRPTRGKRDLSARGPPLEAGIAIDMQDAAEAAGCTAGREAERPSLKK